MKNKIPLMPRAQVFFHGIVLVVSLQTLADAAHLKRTNKSHHMARLPITTWKMYIAPEVSGQNESKSKKMPAIVRENLGHNHPPVNFIANKYMRLKAIIFEAIIIVIEMTVENPAVALSAAIFWNLKNCKKIKGITAIRV